MIARWPPPLHTKGDSFPGGGAEGGHFTQRSPFHPTHLPFHPPYLNDGGG